MLAAAHRSQKERNLFIVALIVSAFVWVALIATLVGLLYAPFVALGVVLGHAFFLARVTGSSIRAGSRQLPDLYKRVENAAAKLGLDTMPEVYVTSGGGVLNAFATKLFSRKFMILNAEILDACEVLDEEKQPGDASAVDFIIGHELGHLALGHLSWTWLLWPAKLFPLLGPAYSRAQEYSADACGHLVAGDVDASSRALAVLAAGGRQAKKVSLDALLEQRHETGGLVMALVELNSTHPFLSKRIAAIHRLRDGDTLPDVGRNPLSYVMAPFFGFAAGGAAGFAAVYMYVVVIGMLAAIAIPNFMKYQERAKEAAALSGPVGIVGDAAQNDDVANVFGKAPPDANVLGALQGTAPADNDAVGGLGGLVQADDAPPPPPPPRFEARTWLKGQIAGKNPEAIANYGTTPAAILVDKLYKAGAAKVFVQNVGVDDKGVFADNIIVSMPSKQSARKKLVDLCSAEYKKRGVTEPCEDNDELVFNWQ